MENRKSSKRPHARLDAWRDAMHLVEVVYRYSNDLPDAERVSLTRQLRRSAASFPSNIAEGAARRSRQDCIRFLSIARGSLAEPDTQLHIAERLGRVQRDAQLIEQVDRIFARLTAPMNSLSSLPQSGRTGEAAEVSPPPFPIPDSRIP